jgi:aryl-alcohol dehydrogenase-like predicted oxidoreductase
LAQELGAPPAQYALAWTLSQPAMTSLVVGVKRDEHIADAVNSLQVRLPAEHLRRLDETCPPPWLQPDPIRG